MAPRSYAEAGPQRLLHVAEDILLNNPLLHPALFKQSL